MCMYVYVCSYGLISPFSQTQCVCLCFLKFSWCWCWFCFCFCCFFYLFCFYASVCLIFLFCMRFRWPRNWVESRKMKCWRDERRWITAAAAATTSVVAAATAAAGAGTGAGTTATFKLWHTQIFQHNALCHIAICTYTYVCMQEIFAFYISIYTLPLLRLFVCYCTILGIISARAIFQQRNSQWKFRLDTCTLEKPHRNSPFAVSLKTKFFSCA